MVGPQSVDLPYYPELVLSEEYLRGQMLQLPVPLLELISLPFLFFGSRLSLHALMNIKYKNMLGYYNKYYL
jgi:hypothetical protein